MAAMDNRNAEIGAMYRRAKDKLESDLNVLQQAEAEMARRIDAVTARDGAISGEHIEKIRMDIQREFLTPCGLVSESCTVHMDGRRVAINLRQGR